MNDLYTYAFAGILLGLSSGIAPGPLLTVVITQTLKHGKIEGAKVAMAPLMTDVPIILITYYILSKLANFDLILGTISILGGLFVLYLGYESIKTKGLEIELQNSKPHSLKKGIIVNALSPHPYLYWITVGVPFIFKAYQVNIQCAIVYVLGFYIFLVGSKMGIAMLVDKSRDFLKNKGYIWTMRILGIVLLGFALFIIKDGLGFFGIF